MSLNNKVVSRYGFTHGDLMDAFEVIANKENWKDKIDFVFSRELELSEKLKYEEAVKYICGGCPKFSTVEGMSRIVGDGYYVWVGA